MLVFKMAVHGQTIPAILTVLVVISQGEGVAACMFNPCTLPGMCPGKTCVQDTSCQVACVCDATSTAPACLEVKVTTEASPTASCSMGVTCVHGQCEDRPPVGVVCVCHDGWSGDECREQTDLCDLDCPGGQQCVILGGGLQLCFPTTEESTTARVVSSVQRERNVCNTSHYERPSASEHECPLPCVYGVCRAVNGSFACECDPGSHGQMCQNPCCRDCGGRGECYYDSKKQEQLCNCWQNYTGSRCEQVRTLVSAVTSPEREATWYRWVAGVSVAVLILLVALLVVLPYVLWRHRVLVVMRVLHFFQQYEDDDDRQWDAFVSYKSNTTDEKFVAHTLFPKLEHDMGFKLHVHFRDFVPGETIADNIIHAVLGSRRTILIVSPEFAASEWTKFEYQVAQQEMLKRKHRIIPILLDDVTGHKENLDQNLKAILGSVTYLEWPRCGSEKKLEKFWKRLELSMPKKRSHIVPDESGTDNRAFNAIHPDIIDIDLTSGDNDKKKQPADNVNELDEDYATINELEMDKEDIDRRDSKHTRTDSGVEMQYTESETAPEVGDAKKDTVELKNTRNATLDQQKAKSNMYVDILNGGLKSADA